MDSSSTNKTLSELVVGVVKSWIPWRSEAEGVSRDFWMPDESCRVCYDCDSHFSLFNRKHHCRVCGRIFCAKCTSNWISATPSSSNEEWDKIRVCNYCYKQWQQGLSAPINCENAGHPHIGIGTGNGNLQDISNTSFQSADSFISTKSNATCDTFVSLPQSSGLSPYPSPRMETSIDRLSFATAINIDHDAIIGPHNLSQEQLEFYPCRSEDEDEDEDVSQLSSRTSHFSDANGYFGNVQFDEIENEYNNNNSYKVNVDGEGVGSKSVNGEVIEQVVEKCGNEYDISDECEGGEVVNDDTEPVDFENNGVLWLPPEPEDEDDEVVFEDDDDGDDTGEEWGPGGYLQHNSTTGEYNYRSRDKSSNEEHKRAIKSVVDGHFRALVAQLLQVENVSTGEENDKESWLEIITSLSWEAATLLKPDTSKGGQMDPGGYVKVKCLASGRRSQSMVVKGVVCKKNVAHRRMTTRIEKPRLMILGGALEYQRVSNALSSFDTLLQQEMDHLKMAVAKIEAHHPDILLVEKSVSRYAQDYLLAKNISLVLNIKKQLLERIGRCTGAQIVSSIDHMSTKKIGHCEMFHVEKFLEEHGSASQAGRKLVKTLMYFEGCPKPLGCTILLQGANGDELKKVKHVVQYGVFAAYHLALETSFLADEGASLPELPLNAPITVALPDKPSSKIDRSISTIPGFTLPEIDKTPGPQFVSQPQRSMSVPTSDLLQLSAVPINQTEVAKTHNNLSAPMPMAPTFSIGHSFHASKERGAFAHYFMSSEAKSFTDAAARLTSCDPVDSNLKITRSQFFGNRTSVPDPLSLQLIGEKIIEGQATLKEEFPPTPSDHQSILVSLSSRCVWKGTVCERSHLLRIKYYGNFDKPLGRFLRDHLFDQNYRCRSCEMPAEAHVQCYTHLQGTLTISVKKLAEILLPGESDGKIWMWHRCLKCPRANGFPPATRRVVMSDAAWGLSFGKFLELSFSNHAAANRVASCGHSLHRDCLRFYGLGNMVACFRYASIDVHSVYLPPPKLNFNYDSQEWIQRELDEVNFRAELLVSEVLNALHLLVQRKSASSHLADLEVMLHKEKSEFEESLQKIVNKEAKSGQPTIDILELNRLRRQLVFQSYMWDHRLIYADSLDDKTQADEMEVSSSETIQKPLAVSEKAESDIINVPVKTGKTLEDTCGYAKPEKSAKLGFNSEIINHHLAGLHQRTSSFFSTDSGNQNLKATDASDNVESEGGTLRRALSDGQVPFCLSETLDAAWTGGNFLGFGFSKNNNLSEFIDADKLSTVGLSEKLDPEDHREDLSMSRVSSTQSFLFPLSADNMEDTVSWLSMPFISFYKSLNKNFLGISRKLDTLGEYDPVYISSFRESELQSGARLLLPVGVNDTVIPVYDDEPTSIISYALISPDYLAQLADETERQRDTAESIFSMHSLDSVNFQSFNSLDEMVLESSKSFNAGDDAMLSFTNPRTSLPLDPLSYSQALHARVSFVDDGPLGKVKYTVTCYYAKRFEALRRMCCPSEVDYVRSLSRCRKWGAQGGKSNVFFAKSMDERFIIKQVTKTELESFIKFAPGYFKYLSESISSRSPTCLAKILGIYQVASKHVKGGKYSKMDVLVMENLLYGRNVSRLYDLKGSTRSRYNSDSTGSNKVLLDQNLIEAMPTCPIFVGNKAKRLLERAVWNDTAFLASVDVMDYSLLVGVDEEKNELVLGIIDFMRQYTWDKHLETWVKASGILGGPKNASPTVISPKQYKRRFRKAMTTYFLMVPDQWSPHLIVPTNSNTEDNKSQS